MKTKQCAMLWSLFWYFRLNWHLLFFICHSLRPMTKVRFVSKVWGGNPYRLSPTFPAGSTILVFAYTTLTGRKRIRVLLDKSFSSRAYLKVLWWWRRLRRWSLCQWCIWHNVSSVLEYPPTWVRYRHSHVHRRCVLDWWPVAVFWIKALY